MNDSLWAPQMFARAYLLAVDVVCVYVVFQKGVVSFVFDQMQGGTDSIQGENRENVSRFQCLKLQ